MLRGWGNSFRTGNAAAKFIEVDFYVWERLTRLVAKIRKRRGVPRASRVRAIRGSLPRTTFEALGRHRLSGTIRHPGRPDAA